MANIIGLDPDLLRPGCGWSARERAELEGLRLALSPLVPSLHWEEGATDVGDPWLVAVDARTDDLAVHVARIGRTYVVLDAEFTPVATGRSLRMVLETSMESGRLSFALIGEVVRLARPAPSMTGQGPEGMPVSPESELPAMSDPRLGTGSMEGAAAGPSGTSVEVSGGSGEVSHRDATGEQPELGAVEPREADARADTPISPAGPARVGGDADASTSNQRPDPAARTEPSAAQDDAPHGERTGEPDTSGADRSGLLRLPPAEDPQSGEAHVPVQPNVSDTDAVGRDDTGGEGAEVIWLGIGAGDDPFGTGLANPDSFVFDPVSLPQGRDMPDLTPGARETAFDGPLTDLDGLWEGLLPGEGGDVPWPDAAAGDLTLDFA